MIPFSFVNTLPACFHRWDLVEVWQVHCMGRFSTQAVNKTMGTRVAPTKTSPLPIFPYEIEGHWDPLLKKIGDPEIYNFQVHHKFDFVVLGAVFLRESQKQILLEISGRSSPPKG